MVLGYIGDIIGETKAEHLHPCCACAQVPALDPITSALNGVASTPADCGVRAPSCTSPHHPRRTQPRPLSVLVMRKQTGSRKHLTRPPWRTFPGQDQLITGSSHQLQQSRRDSGRGKWSRAAALFHDLSSFSFSALTTSVTTDRKRDRRLRLQEKRTCANMQHAAVTPRC